MTRRRALRPEERALWQAVADSTRPLPGKAPAAEPHIPVAGLPPALAPAPAPPPPDPIPPFRIGGSQGVARHGPLPAPPPPAPPRMDAKAFRQMTRGRLVPEARIDLHGMTLAEAHPELIRFILSAWSDGMRLVLVITGKGKPGTDAGPVPRRTGALRHDVPHWLRQAPLAPVVLQVAVAHARHGGSGALYVYLRRPRG